MVFRKPGQILKVARLSLFKLFHPTGGILCSSVTEVVLGRGWAAQGQEQDGMFAISRSVCLSARVMEGPQGGLAGEGRDLGQDVVSAQPLSEAGGGGLPTRNGLRCFFVSIDLKTRGRGDKTKSEGTGGGGWGETSARGGTSFGVKTSSPVRSGRSRPRLAERLSLEEEEEEERPSLAFCFVGVGKGSFFSSEGCQQHFSALTFQEVEPQSSRCPVTTDS